jgi:hypothetical protein
MGRERDLVRACDGGEKWHVRRRERKGKRVLMVWWSVACGGDEFRSERMIMERKKKATRFVKRKKKASRILSLPTHSFFLFLTFSLVGGAL